MPRIVPIVFLMFLAGCGYHGCMSQADMYSDEVRSVVHANPSKDSDGGVQAWTKIDFPVEGKGIKLSVEHHGLNFCDKSEVNGKILDVPDSAPLKSGSDGRTYKSKYDVKISYPDKISKGETLTFTLDPIKQFVIDETICRNQHEDIRVTDVDNCLSNHIGQTHSVYYSHKLAAAKGGFTNSWYVKTKGGGIPFIVDDVVPVLLRTGADDVGENGKIRVPERLYSNLIQQDGRALDEGLCWTREELQEKAGSQVSNESQVDDAQKKREETLASLRSKTRKLREGLKNILDEQSLNILCDKLCPADGTKAVTTIYEGAKCQGVHLVTRKEESNEIPFVTLQKENFKEKPHVRLDGPSLVDTAEVPNDISSKMGLQYQKIRDEKREYDISIPSDRPPKYLRLDTPYEYVGADSVSDINLILNLEGEDKIFHLTGGRPIVGRYSISIKKDCSAHVGSSLYYKFSEVPLRGVEGFEGAEEIKFLERGVTDIDDKHQKGHLYIGVKDNGDGYDNNVGFYEIRFRISKIPPKVFSHITDWTEGKVRKALYGSNNDDSVVKKLYQSISKSGAFMRMVNALLVLYVIVSALYFILGFSKASIYQLVIIVFKVIVVMFVLRPDSWTFFNDHLLNLFINAPKFLIDAMTGGKGANFEFMDNILYRFSISQTWIQLLALIFAGPIGWLSVVLIFWGLVVLVQFLFQAIVIYLISIMTIALLLCIAPYFLVCILFRRTKNIFDMWIKILLQTAMQPVVIFTCIALLVTAINDVIYAMLNFEVCDACVFKADLKVTTVCLLSFPLPIGVIPTVPISDTIRELYNTGENVVLGLPGPMANILIFLALVHAARDFVLNSGEMCSIMFGAFTNLSEVGSTAAQSLLSVVGMDKSTGQMLEHHRRQSELFSRGPGAGRDEGSLMGSMRGSFRESGGDGRGRRPVIIPPGEPPASF
ncbi:type IV secretion system protein, VirB6 family [Anaplasma platys]|uniref:Type IV secretion system protein, VirB6 family n=1 Tax=Anaplasma platys TaxID=949 RepID=A0A858PXU3_9RICK|nr:type IV secretion system protein [Anaplasma platys]QJC27426.1 type IV secretion system protein, VirB6 family [Anaplasma platys]